MSDSTTPQSVLFPELFSKPLIATFDQPQASSDGGAVLLRAADKRLGLTENLTAAMTDSRQSGKVTHALGELLSQRVFGIAAGYPDCNDITRLADDPILKLLVHDDVASDRTFGSQSTLSRFENSLSRTDLYRLGLALAETVVERQRDRLRGRAKRITIDLDPTDTATFGEQQLTFFNAHYDNYCYLPTLGFITFDHEREQYAFAALLRPGNVGAARGAQGILRRTFALLRKAFPKAIIRVRLDGGFASDEMFSFFESEKVDFLAGMAENKVLAVKAEALRKQAKRAAEQTGKTEQFFGECRYAAKSWGPRRRRVIIKAEVVHADGRMPKENTRFVVTNLKHSPEEIYRVDYCGRGEVENRIKELKDLRIDRMSCTNFKANQFRLILTIAAFALVQEIRARIARTALGRAQVWTLREKLFKIAAHVVSSARRLVIHFAQNCAATEAWCSAARSLGAVSG